jgi:hypothetical protein
MAATAPLDVGNSRVACEVGVAPYLEGAEGVGAGLDCEGIVAGSSAGGNCGVTALFVAAPLESTLSTVPVDLDGRKKTLITRLMTMNAPARICVPRMRKSAVRRTPNTIPTFPPPKVPANPPPLLDCIRITTIKSRHTRTSRVISSENIVASVVKGTSELD